MTREYSANPQHAKEAVIAVVMLAVLAASVAAAWWLSGARQARASEASSILAEIREKGMEAFLGKEPPPQWFLIHEGGKIVGWHMRILARMPDGGYAALETQIVHAKKNTGGYWEKWGVGPRAQKGRYASGKIGITTAGAAGISHDTTIEYDHGTLKVKQFLDRKNVDPRMRGGSDLAQNNYLPEGVSDVAAILIARRKTKAQFRTVLNNRPFTGADSLPTFTFSYDGKADEKKFGPGAKRIKVSLENISWVYVMNASGKCLAKIFSKPGRTELATTSDELLARYPDAMKIMDFVRLQTQGLAVYE